MGLLICSLRYLVMRRSRTPWTCSWVCSGPRPAGRPSGRRSTTQTTTSITRSNLGDPWHFGTDPDSDPRIHTFDWRIRILLFLSVTFKMATRKNFLPSFLVYYLLKQHWHNFLTINSHKKFTKRSNEGSNYRYYFCLMIEGSGSLTMADSPNNVFICKYKNRPYSHVRRGLIILWSYTMRTEYRRARLWLFVDFVCCIVYTEFIVDTTYGTYILKLIS